MDYKLVISITALTISILSLGWNIWNKINSEKKKLLIQSYKSKSNEIYNCVITLTNYGNKPIYVRRIEIEEKKNGKIEKVNVDYNQYREKFENKPLNPDDWRTIILCDTKYMSFFDNSEKKFKKTRIIIVDPKGNKYSTKWFGQNNSK